MIISNGLTTTVSIWVSDAASPTPNAPNGRLPASILAGVSVGALVAGSILALVLCAVVKRRRRSMKIEHEKRLEEELPQCKADGADREEHLTDDNSA